MRERKHHLSTATSLVLVSGSLVHSSFKHVRKLGGHAVAPTAAVRKHMLVGHMGMQGCKWAPLLCRWGHTPLQHAITRRHGPAIELLQLAGADLGFTDAARPLCAAAIDGDMRLLTRLLDNGVDANARCTFLHRFGECCRHAPCDVPAQAEVGCIRQVSLVPAASAAGRTRLSSS